MKLDLTVVVQHAHQNNPDKGKDTSIDGMMGIKLAYRADDTEPYVEVVGAATDRSSSKEVWYDAGTRSDNGLVTTTTFHDLYTALDQNYQYSVNVKLADYAVISKEEVEKYAKLPSKETLLSQLVFMLQSPIQRVAIAINEIAKKNEEQSA